MRMIKISLVLLMTFLILASCGNKKDKPPVDLSKGKINLNADIEVQYSEFGGVKTIPVKLNGVSMDMIFDTGCSGLSLSLNELQTLVKNNKITDADVMGVSYATIADGSIVKNGRINLREVEVGGKDGIVLHNIEASVALNQVAPMLLGNGVLDEVASVEVDNINKVIKFRRR